MSRFLARILAVNIFLIVLCTLCLSVAVHSGYREMIEERFSTETKDLSFLLSEYSRDVLLNKRNSDATDVFHRAAAARNNRHFLFNEERELVASSVKTDDTYSQNISPLYSELNAKNPTLTRTLRDQELGEYELVLRSILDNGKTIGYLQIEANRKELNTQLRSYSGVIWGIALCVIVVGAGISTLLYTRMIRPIDELTQAAWEISRGNWSQALQVSSHHEFSTLAKAFNEMSRELTRHIQELEVQAQQMRDNSERLATVLGGMVEGVIAVDENEHILFANQAAFDLIEFEGKRVVGRPYWEVVRNMDVQKVVKSVLDGKFQAQQEIEIPRTQSRIAFIASSLPGDKCRGVVLVLHDVTELRRLEKIRSEFVSNVGHELKTPLAAIRACTDAMLDAGEEDVEARRRFLPQISEHADRLHHLILDLMELAKIESEEDAFSLTEIDVGIPIQEAIDEHRSMAESKNINFRYEPMIEELIVKADLDAFRTIINNLLDNAFNYTPSGGDVFVKWYSDADEAVVEISDTGIGIDPSSQERIFERFYRVDSARSRDLGGTGLGLAIVKHLCNFMSGTIHLESEPNQGSKFTVRFPQFHSAILSDQFSQN